MTAKEFILDKIENKWVTDLRDVSYDNLDILSKAFDEYATINRSDLVIDFARMFQSNGKWSSLTPEEMAEVYLDQ